MPYQPPIDLRGSPWPTDGSATPTTGRAQRWNVLLERRGGSPHPRILFVDDEPALTKVAVKAMRFSGYEVEGYTEPAIALAALKQRRLDFDAMITDLAMPRMTGLELIREARSIRPDLPIVLTSGYLTELDRIEAARFGVWAVVPKPCSIDDLAAQVRDALSARPSGLVGARSA